MMRHYSYHCPDAMDLNTSTALGFTCTWDGTWSKDPIPGGRSTLYRLSQLRTMMPESSSLPFLALLLNHAPQPTFEDF